jgi:hypothetical protein
MKDSVITIRLSDEQKLKLEAYSCEKDTSISKTIRSILNKELSEPKLIDLGDGRVYNESYDKHLLQSHDFTSLIFWLFDKLSNPYADETEEYYKDLVRIIEKIEGSRLFKNDFVKELQKVKAELEICINDKKFDQFTFPYDDFDYEIFRSAFHIIMFNSDNEKIIN